MIYTPPGNAVPLLALAVRECHTGAIGDLSGISNNFNPRNENSFIPYTHSHESQFVQLQIAMLGKLDSKAQLRNPLDTARMSRLKVYGRADIQKAQ